MHETEENIGQLKNLGSIYGKRRFLHHKSRCMNIKRGLLTLRFCDNAFLFFSDFFWPNFGKCYVAITCFDLKADKSYLPRRFCCVYATVSM